MITGRRKPRGKDLTPAQRAANRLQAQLRCVGERGNARLKYWKVLVTKVRCRPERCTAMVKAVLALHYRGTRPVHGPARHVTRADRYQADMPALSAGPVSRRRSKSSRKQRKESRPGLSNQAAPCDNSG